MSRRVASSWCVMVVLLVGTVAFAQSVEDLEVRNGYPVSPGLSNSVISFSNGTVIAVAPKAAVGFQHMTLNVSIPVPGGSSLGDPPQSTMDITLRDANLWVGTVGIEAISNSGIGLTLQASSNAGRSASVQTEFDGRLAGFTANPDLSSPWAWTASKITWWCFDGALTYRLRSGYTVLAGFRMDKTDFRLEDPTNRRGSIPFQSFQFPWSVLNGSEAGDFSTSILAPYVGVAFKGTNYSASILATPISWANTDASIAANIMTQLLLNPPIVDVHDTNYQVHTKLGYFVEAYGQYDLSLYSALRCTLWGKGSLFTAKGRGNMRSQTPTAQGSRAGSSNEDVRNSATVTSQILAMGFAVSLGF